MVITSLQEADLGVCNSSEFAAAGEALSFWQLQMRVQSAGQVCKSMAQLLTMYGLC